MKKYDFIVSQECMLSKIPSLFPYIDWNKDGQCELHSATDNYNGSYGHIVPNLRISIGNKIPSYHSYYNIMDVYYKGNDNTVKDFVDEAIGKIVIDKSIFEKDMDLVPDFIYLSNAKKMYHDYLLIKKQCELYNNSLKKYPDNFDAKMCCLCEKYQRIGGDLMLDTLKELKDKALSVAEKYLNFAQKDTVLNFNIILNQNIDDIGIFDTFIGKWVPRKRYYKGDIVLFDNEIYECLMETSGKYDEKLEKVVFDYTAWKINSSKTVNVPKDDNTILTTDSKLKSLRRYTEYLNANDESEVPSYGEDWLFYYRKGFVSNYRTINDTYGNICHYGNDNKNGNDLKAYGDVLIDITYEEDNYKIIFKYILDCHLTAKYEGVIIDDDNKERYLFSDFKYDENDNHGVQYTDVYYYDKDSDIDKLIKSGGFNNYINNGELTTEFDVFSKFVFNTLSSIMDNNIIINNEEVKAQSIVSNISTTYANGGDDVMDVPLVRIDYLNGITYSPSLKIDVDINRGNTSAFEKHISFSEVKTLEAMENYRNGSFFSMRNDI